MSLSLHSREAVMLREAEGVWGGPCQWGQLAPSGGAGPAPEGCSRVQSSRALGHPPGLRWTQMTISQGLISAPVIRINTPLPGGRSSQPEQQALSPELSPSSLKVSLPLLPGHAGPF